MPRTSKKETKTTKVTAPKKAESSLEASVFSPSGEEVSKIKLPEAIFKAKINKSLLSQAIKVYRANHQQGTLKTKTRGEVRGGGKKPWRQKGTGRARQGSTRAPHWRGGGVTFGPRPRDFDLKLPKAMRRIALFSALTSKYNDSKIKILENLDNLEGKTKDMIKTLTNLKLTGKILLASPNLNQKAVLSCRNIEDLKITKPQLLNTYDVLNNDNIVFLESSIKVLEETFLSKKQ